MNMAVAKEMLLWSLGVNYSALIVWFCVFAIAHDQVYRLHTRWFKLSVETFDTLHYGGMGVYKIGILLFNVAPLIALYLAA